MGVGTLEATGRYHMLRGHLVLLVLIVLFAPSMIMIQRSSYVGGSSTTVSLVAPLWAVSHSYGSNYGGPFDRMTLSLLDPIQIVTLGVVVMSLFLFLRVRSFATKGERRSFLTDIGVTAFVLIIYSGGFWYSLDAFYTSGAIALPVMPILGSIIVYDAYKHQE